MNNVILAVAMAFCCWLCRGNFGYTFRTFAGSPVVIGFVAGLITGDMKNALIIGGSVQLIYLGTIAPGGALPSDYAMAAATVTPIALNTGMTPEVAVSLAVPMSLLGVFLINCKKTIAAAFVHKADQYAEEGNVKGIWRCATLFPAGLSFLFIFMPVLIIDLFGSKVADVVLKAIPDFLMHGLEVAGGMLPALGFAMMLLMIGKTTYLPFMIIGFFVVKYFELSTVGASIFGICIALLVVFLKREAREETN